MTEIRDWAALLAAAKKARACSESYNKAAKYSSFEEASLHPDAPQWALEYACHVIKGRWPEAEALISSDPQWAYEYANYVVEGRWPEAEAVIAESPKYAYLYALYVVKGRWPEAACEAALAQPDHSGANKGE